MLNLVHKFRESFWGKAIFGLLAFFLIVSFAVWGIGDIFLNPDRERVVAKVGSVRVMSSDFLRVYRDETEKIAELLGEDFDSERGRELGFVRSVLNTLVGRALFDNIVENLDLAIGREAMRSAVISTPQFQDEFGTFNELLFRRVLGESGFSEETFLRSLKGDLKRKQLISTVIAAPKVPKIMLESLAAVRKEQRTAESILIAIDELPEPPEPKKAALEKWHEENSEDYQRPELRSFSYFNVSPKQLLGEIVVGEEEVKELYEQRKPSFEVAERRNILQIRLEDEQKAAEAMKRLEKGEDFFKVAERVAGMNAEDVSLGWNTEDDLIEELTEPVFAQGLKEAGGPYKTPFGWHIVRVEEIEEGKTFTFAEKRQELTDELALEEAIGAVYGLMTTVEDELAAGASLEEAAAAVNVETKRVDKASMSGERENGEKIELPLRLFTEAFALQPQAIGGVVDLGEDGFFVQRVDEVEESRPQTFAEAEKEILADWRRREKTASAAAKAQRVKKELSEGEGLRSIAARLRLKVVDYKPFSRFSYEDQEIPPQFADALFAAAPGETVAVAIREGQIIGLVTEIIPPGKNDESDFERIEEAIYSNLGADLVSQYQSWLAQKYRISINDNAIDELL